MTNINWTNSYRYLGSSFYSDDKPMPVAEPHLLAFNENLASELGLSNSIIDQQNKASIFSGNQLIAGSEPLAMAYSGHQFGHFSPQLGDGRAVLLGNFFDSNKTEYDLQLKGSGRTAFSRGGDGRSALGPVLREYIVSEAMAKLGVPTTRALAAVTTGEKVAREGYVPGGIITRISRSLIRVGTFQYFSSRNELESVKKLADYAIERNYSEIVDDENKYQTFLSQVIERQAQLISRWMGLGFIHGVMNTDNMSICGETIDYGPCAFMDDFDFNKKFSFIDKQGRYAYSNQPQIALWDLTRFAESILSLLADDQEDAVKVAELQLNKFPALYEKYWLNEISAKLGLVDANLESKPVKKIADDLLNLMAESKTDFTNTFYHLSLLNNEEDEQDDSFTELFSSNSRISQWLERWRLMINKLDITEDARRRKMRLVNPTVIPRNHQIEKAIRAAEDNNNFEPFNKLNEILRSPFVYSEEKDEYMKVPAKEEVVERTFCGT